MSPYASARGTAAGHLVNLRGALDALGEQLREAVARAVGRAAGDALRDALHAALDAGRRGPARATPHAGLPQWWDSRDRPAWGRDPDEARYAAAYREDDRYADDYGEPNDEDAESGRADPGTPPRPSQDIRPRWVRALTAGVQAAAWWLRRGPGRPSLLGAAAVGLVAGLAAFAGGPLAGAAGVAASALALLALADAAREGAAALAGDDTP